MDLSQDMQDILKTMKVLIKENIQISSNNSLRLPLDRSSNAIRDELIDINNINFQNDEYWLYESPVKNSNVKDLRAWLYQDTAHLKNYDFHNNRLSLIRELAQNDTKKLIDSRTFTRPKKRINRPSIEMYNDGYFGMNKSDSEHIADESESTKTLKVNAVDDTTIAQPAPLKFDLSQPTTSSIFENIIATAPDVDSFQNMSPPSLINSMCSSTFTNLMENSMIKNDPLLREISVTDYTEAMLQDYDPPLFRSITDSCSSINLDNPESFIKQNSQGTLNGIYKKSLTNNDNSLNETYTAELNNSVLDVTYLKESSSDVSSNDVCCNEGVVTENTNEMQSTLSNKETSILNGTYRKSSNSKLNETFQKVPLCRSNDNLNGTVTYIKDSNRFTSPKRRSYIVDTHKDLSQASESKRNSFAHSVGSSDSLDYLSSLSSSSRDSNKMLNMAEVDAIVLQQEQSINLQVMSTPNPTSKIIGKLWENSNISPVIPLRKDNLSSKDNLSDSEQSSNDEYKTVRSNLSPSDSNSSAKTISKNFEHCIGNEVLKTSPKSLNGMKSISNNKIPDIKGSYSNLKTVGTTFKGSYTNLRPISGYAKSTNSIASFGTKGSTTNLKTMSTNLKGSYTQLKPVLLNLPCTDSNLKGYNPNSKVKKKANPSDNIQIAEVTPTLRDIAFNNQVKQISSDSSSAKPQSRASGLPRPISNIPRPSVSKIPGPRSRPLTARPLYRPTSKNNLDYDF